MVMIEELFKETLKNHHLFKTVERIRLFQELKDMEAPCSIAQLVAKTKGALDTTTVYRNLEIFEEIGIIQRIYSGWKYKVELSDAFSPHHHHMICIKCDRILSFEEHDGLKKELKQLASQYYFSITTHSLELKGLCKDCSSLN